MQLNLPSFDIQLRRDPGPGSPVKVYDPLRRKWIIVTPEEWVRQHFVNFLVSERMFPPQLMANEISLHLNGNVRR